MKKRVIQINGLSGLFMMLFIISCLIAGFICFPAYVSMNVWNYFATKIDSMVSISFIGGLLLWGIIAISFMIFHKRHLIVSFGIPSNMTKEELSELFKKAETQTPEDILKEIEQIQDKNSDSD